MTDDESSPSRRAILASLGSIGAVTAAGSAETTSSLFDDEVFSSGLQAGRVELDVDCDGCALENGQLQLELESVAPGESKTKTVRFTVPDSSNSVRLWVRTECPPADDPLGEALEARLSVRPGCKEDGRLFPLSEEWMTFTALRRKLHNGVRLDDPENPCLAAGEQLCLDLEYRLPEDATWAMDDETGLVLESFAQQCRHVSESEVDTSPFPDEDCPTIECPNCIELGKLEVKDDQLEPDIYDFDERYNDYDDTYQLEVLTVTDKVDEEERETVCASVRLLKKGSESIAPPICKVEVKGGPQTVPYDIDPPLTRTRGEVCAANNEDDPDAEPDSQRPAISNLTVFVCSKEVGANG